MTLFFLQGKDDVVNSHTKSLFGEHNPWVTLVSDPDSMYCALICANSEGDARSLAQSISQAPEPVWQDHQWSSCTEVDASMALLIAPGQERGIVKVGLVRHFLTPF